MAVRGTTVAEPSETASAILDIAERLVQRRGFNGFSYADIAAELGITKASLHYHFRGKAELGESLIDRYATRFAEALDEIGARPIRAGDKLRAYCEIYRGVLEQGRMCLCGMLAADYETLPESMRGLLIGFFDQNATWLTDLLEGGRAARHLTFGGPADDAARSVIATLEGAMLVARPYGTTTQLDAVIRRLTAEFVAPTAPPRRSAGASGRR
jgi:TetR/AcrR family transcriptional repressor of nem operon